MGIGFEVPSRVRRPGTSIAGLGLGLIGAVLGASQLIHGAYDEATWPPIALQTLALLLALAVGVSRRPPLAALVSLLGLWLSSLVSGGWSDSADAARIAADRWLLYAAALALLWWAVGENRAAPACCSPGPRPECSSAMCGI